jgi:hypothetical protein
MRKRWERRCIGPSADDSSDDDDDIRVSCPHLHDHQTHIMPGRMIGLCLRTAPFSSALHPPRRSDCVL